MKIKIPEANTFIIWGPFPYEIVAVAVFAPVIVLHRARTFPDAINNPLFTSFGVHAAVDTAVSDGADPPF